MGNPYSEPLCSPKKEKKILVESKRYQLKHGKCRYCGSVKDITKDHIIPKSRGGKNWISNMQPLCRYCNYLKSDKTEQELFYIFSSIKTNGVWYDWEKPFARWIDWLEIVCKERKHKNPFLHS